MKTILDLARECGAFIEEKWHPDTDDFALESVGFTHSQLAAFAERIRADERESGQLMRAATRVLSDIEAAYRPPVRQALWAGEYARVRTCALWDLQDAVVAIKPEFGQRHSPEEQAQLNTALAQVFDWPKEQVQPQPSAAEQSSIHTGSGAIFGDLSTSSCPAEREAFEVWLRTVCFQKPTPEAHDLARDAWHARAAFASGQPKACDSVQVGGESQVLAKIIPVPSQPDEREAFEAWRAKDKRSLAPAGYDDERASDWGSNDDEAMQRGWQARAALAASQSLPACVVPECQAEINEMTRAAEVRKASQPSACAVKLKSKAMPVSD